MFILIGVEGSNNRIYEPNPHDIRKEIPEVVTYFNTMTKCNKVLCSLKNYSPIDHSSNDYDYILLPPQSSSRVNDKSELFHSIKEFEDSYKNSGESIYIIPDTYGYDDIISICDTIMLSSINKSPESTIEYNNNIFDITNKSLDLISKHGYKYYHSVYIRQGIESVLLV